MAAIFRAGAIHGLCFPLDFVNARLSSEGHVNNWVLFLLIMLVIGLLYIIHSSTSLSSLLPSPFTRPPLSGDGDQEHALLGHGVREERGDLWWVISLPFKPGVMLASSSGHQLHKSAIWHQESNRDVSKLLNLDCCLNKLVWISKVTWLMDRWEQ